MADKIRDGMVVSLAYTLTADGQTVEVATAEEPLDYLHGAENIVPGLEAALTGRNVGDKFSITLKPAEAYGEYVEDDIETIPRSDVPDAANLQPGMGIMLEDEDGYMFEATVSEVTADTIVLDFNPPLAGKTITYDVEVVTLREAEEEEIAAGQPYGFADDDDLDYDYEDDEDYEDEDEE